MVTHFNNCDNDDIHPSGGDDLININNIILTRNKPEKDDNGGASLVNLICNCYHSVSGYPFELILFR